MRFCFLMVLISTLLFAGCAGKNKDTDELAGRYILGLSHLANQDPSAALNELISVVEEEPRNVEYQEALAYAYFLKKAYVEAERHYLKALRLVTDGAQKAQVENNLGSLYLEMRRWDEALPYFSSAASSLVFQDTEVALTGAGVVLARQGKAFDALDSFRNALKENPSYLPAYFRMGELYRDMEQPEQSVAAFEQILNLNPDSVETHYQLGLTYLQLGDAAKARSAFEKTLELEPDSEQSDRARENLRLLK